MNFQKKTASVENLLSEERRFVPSEAIRQRAHIHNFSDYELLYQRSLEISEAFWLEQAETLEWMRKPQKACRYTWNTSQNIIKHTWFEDGQINVSINCLDRHLLTARKSRIAIIWQGDDDEETVMVSYEELHAAVCRFANVLKTFGVVKGDRVCIYLPMIPEAAIAMLACARIGAIHSVVFAGFSAESLAHRINDSACKILITSNVSIRGGKHLDLKEVADEAVARCPSIDSVIVVKRTDDDCPMEMGRDFWYHERMGKVSDDCPAEKLDAEDPLFILYTSGSTGKPKGVVHTQAGYLLQATMTHKYIFDIQDDDVYWCTADVGWVTGHSYGLYGPLANGSTTLMFEGSPTFPNPGRFWQVIEKYRVSVFYTAPTVIRSLISTGDSWPNKHDLSSLRILGTVGEPINPEPWLWYYEVIGKKRCPVVDTWWQTETGGIMLAPFPGSHILKPGSASRPFFGVDPVVLRDQGEVCLPNEGGALCIRRPWPGIMRTTWGDHQRFVDTYFSTFENVYFSGDGCRVDEDGDFWLLGRLDDVVNVSGHRIGTSEVESALVSHPDVAEAAVVPMPHEVKGQGLLAFVTLKEGVQQSSELKKVLTDHVRKEIGPIAVPQEIRFASALPKTRSGKIMRRILCCIAANQLDSLGDISTLADPAVLKDLIR